MSKIPSSSYGASMAPAFSAKEKTQHAASIQELGFAVIDSGLVESEMSSILQSFNELREEYLLKYGAATLTALGEKDIMRMPLIHKDDFLRLIFNKNLISLVDELIEGTFILNQQNALLNQAQGSYSQASWHRDLPYQHFVTTKPIAVSCLYCLDDFTSNNGATHVLPGSHKHEWLPSAQEIKNLSIQLEAKRGQFIIIDSMCFHAGGINESKADRRGINHVFTIPYIKQQITLPLEMESHLSDFEKGVLGFKNLVPDSVEAFLNSKKEAE